MTHSLAWFLLADPTGADSWVTPWLEPLRQTPWTDWPGFWIGRLTFGRQAVLYFLPLLPVLLAWPTRQLRSGIILTGVVFMAYVFGPLYLLLWLLTCVIFYQAGQTLATRFVQPGGPSRWVIAVAIGLLGGHLVLVHSLGQLKLPGEWNTWLVAHAPWLLPLGARGLAGEPHWFASGGFELFDVLLGRAHDIGAAYLTMRMVAYFAELRRGTIAPERRRFTDFLAYVCYAPTLIQGPLERYTEFQEQIETCHQRRRGGDRAAGAARFFLGLLKNAVAQGYLHPLLVTLDVSASAKSAYYRQPEQIQSYALLFFGVHLQVLLVYLAFSGYCDVAIGLSRLLGYRVIENFRWPWLACSLTDMWRRWHISLSFILRDYVFFPLARRRWNTTVSLLITFWVCGFWHDAGGKYTTWGVAMGLMVAVNQKWSRWMRELDRHPQRRLAALRRAWLKLQPLPRLCAWLLAQNAFLMSGWICLGGSGALRVVWELIRRPLQWLLQPWGVTLAPVS